MKNKILAGLAAMALLGAVAAMPAKASAQSMEDYVNHLIKPGTQSPDFTLTKVDGSKTTLYEALKGHKATIVNFWFFH